MIYKKFIIHKYKAINNVEINLLKDIIPIIGINESGKTSLLQAILAFDKHNDHYFSGLHLQAKNRYDYDSKNHIITAEILIENPNELEQLRKSLNLRTTVHLYRELKIKQENNRPIIISRNLDDQTYNTSLDTGLSASSKEFLDYVLMNTPFVLFFDDFTDRVPEKIIFLKDYTGETYSENDDITRNEWNIFIEEIFVRTTEKKYNLKSFLKTEKKLDRDGILSDVSKKLNEDVIKDWEKLKILKKELNSEIKGLKLVLSYDKDQNENHIFSFTVIDRSNDGKDRYFNITERSKGFQWFFNFAIKLKYNTKYKKDFKGAIYLLDEPGSYLHSSAQEELLKSLKEISQTNKVIYCTHSQYLLNPDIININNIKISQRTSGQVNLLNFSEYSEVNHLQGALSPLFDALQLNIGRHVIPKDESLVITEGITDYYFINMIKEFTNLFSESIFTVVPGMGASQLKELISFSIAWSSKYILLLDSDIAGKRAFGKYKKFFEDKESEKWLMYSLKTKKDEVVLEDFLVENDQKKIKSLTSASECKQAIISLYFMENSVKKDFFKNLNENSIKRISHLAEEIKVKFALQA